MFTPSTWITQLGRRVRQHAMLACLIASSFLSACITPVSDHNWPASIPDRQLFERAWAQQLKQGTVGSDLEAHLVWVVRFYQGSVIYPIGWNDMTESVLASIEDTDARRRAESKLRELGIAICIEWAQNNGDRKIDSKAVAVWGNALRTAVERGEQQIFIDKIEQDVQALLNEDLELGEIVRERYYPPQDYDNF